jgi:hypothetical protein
MNEGNETSTLDNVVTTNILDMSNFKSEVIQKYNNYSDITVSGPKWSKESS